MSVFEVRNVTRRFGEKTALRNVSLDLPKGQVLGLIGENGAGKTTLIKHLLGLLRPDEGSVRVFGLDPVFHPERVLARVGYLAEEDGLPGWMRIDEYQRYAAAFYPTWNRELADRLCSDFGLEPRARLKTLSKGQRARVGLMAAMAFEPDLLVLDEPSSGLDPIVRRDILGAVIRAVADEGRTVLFSSHLLAEIERIADRVAMIRGGEILFCDDLDAVKQGHLRVTLRFPDARTTPPELDGAFLWEGEGAEWSALYRGDVANLEATAALADARLVDRRWLSLDEIFVARSSRVEA
jgi:ABC-2 type transport system ATP-binding protein